MPVPHPAPLSGATYSAVELSPAGDVVVMLDQRRLPREEHYVELRDAASVAEAIRAMVVRGAPAIGIAAAYGLAVEARRGGDLRVAGELLTRARPTAVNLKWAVDRILASLPASPEQIAEHARTIHREDVAACRAMGRIGAAHLPDRGTVLTHCNAGALATGGYGTALGVIRAAREMGKDIRVLSCETRPYLQGARLTCWELERDGVPVELITDSMAAHFFGRGMIDAVVVGADRVALNGDVANKIGTYGHAIVIEERSSDEVVRIGEHTIAPANVHARHPGFDVTPARYVTRLITELGAVAGDRARDLM
jgi:methylthioribose-1-phosphate isomerase